MANEPDTAGNIEELDDLPRPAKLSWQGRT
jgi:hypothetical protein